MTIAYLAQCHPLAAVVVSFLFGGLLVGGNTIQKLGLPVSTVQMDPRLHFDFCRSWRHVHQISHRP